jgi:hypothetical protein
MTELVCAGVHEIKATPLAVNDNATPTTKPADLPAGALPMAAEVRLQISFDPPRQPIDEVVVLR